MAENSSNFGKRLKATDSRSWVTSNKINLKPRYIIIKLLKTKSKEMITTRRLSNKADFRAKKISGNR